MPSAAPSASEKIETVELIYGNPRSDTATPAFCGTGNENTGFSALSAVNRLGSGPAIAELRLLYQTQLNQVGSELHWD